MRASSRVITAGLVAAALALAPSRGEAQFGKLMKKAAEKAAAKVGEKAGDKAAERAGVDQAGASARGRCAPPTFDDVRVELTATRLDGIVKALKVEKESGGAQRASLVSRQEAAQQRLHAVENSESIRRAEESESEYRSCRDDHFRGVMEARMERMQADGGGTPEMMRVMREHNERIQAAAAKGDTEHAKALQDSTFWYYQKAFAPSKADTAAMVAKCGHPPAPSTRIAERDSLRRVVRQLNDQIRAIDDRNEAAIRSASGLSGMQLGQARERIIAALGGTTCGYTEQELEGIKARRAELEALLKG
ncbi:MAG: hypothetical protein ACYC3Q_13140 [Gemmatimonadaceae bacterium]